MDIILIPGMWLDASSWDQVVPVLQAAGHRTHALTLPGMGPGMGPGAGPGMGPGLQSRDAGRSAVTLADHVAAVVAAVDSLDPLTGKVALVAHSAGGALAHAAVDARPDRVARVVYVASEPRADGDIGGDFPAENGEVPLPDWSVFDAEMVADLDEELRESLRARAIPVPERVMRDPLRLSDPRRFEVPITVIACEYPSEMLKGWMAHGVPGAQELTRINDVSFVDLPAGHWPQFTRPEDVGRAIVASIAGAA